MAGKISFIIGFVLGFVFFILVSAFALNLLMVTLVIGVIAFITLIANIIRRKNEQKGRTF